MVEVGHQGVGVYLQELVAVGVGHQEMGAYLQELVVAGFGHQEVGAYLQEMVVGVGHQEVGVYLQELMVKKVDCLLGVEEEVWRSLVLAQERNLLVGEGELHVSLVEHWKVVVQMLGWVWVLQEVTVEVGPHVTVSCEVVVVCWVWEEGSFLDCLVLMKNLDGPWEDLGHCYGHQRGLLEV